MAEDFDKIKLYVRDSFQAKINLYLLLPIILIIPIVCFAKHNAIPGFAFMLIFLVAYSFINKFQKELKYNISSLNKFVPKDVFFIIDHNSGKIFLTGVEIAFCDIKEIKFEIAQQPKLIGMSKQFLEKNFINTNIEIITTAKSYTTPVQSKEAIKKLEKIFNDLNLNTTLDLKFYNV